MGQSELGVGQVLRTVGENVRPERESGVGGLPGPRPQHRHSSRVLPDVAAVRGVTSPCPRRQARSSRGERVRAAEAAEFACLFNARLLSLAVEERFPKQGGRREVLLDPKLDVLYRRTWPTRGMARSAISEYIEGSSLASGVTSRSAT